MSPDAVGQHLHAVFAQLYDFVDESGFEAPSDGTASLIDIANGQVPVLEEITRRQRRPKFDKEAHFRATWPSHCGETQRG